MGFSLVSAVLFFFNDTATTEIYTLSLHDALPICGVGRSPGDAVIEADGLAQPQPRGERFGWCDRIEVALEAEHGAVRSEEHTSELQSPCNLVCRLLLEKKKRTDDTPEALVTRATI